MAKINITSNIGDLISQFSSFQSLLQGGVTRAIGRVGTALKALAANPIGAILTAVSVAIAAITAAMSKFQPAIDKFNQAWAAANAAIDVVIDRLQSVGVIFEALITGEIGLSEALGRLSTSFDGVTEEIVREAKEASNLEAAYQRLQDREIELLTIQAELRAESREALLASADQNLSLEERIRFLGEAETAIRTQFANEREVAEERARILREQLALGNSTREDRRELAELEAQLINLRAEEATQLKEISGVRSGLNRQLDAEIIAKRQVATVSEIIIEANENEVETLEDLQRRKEMLAARDAKIAEIRADAEVAANDIRIASAGKLGDALTTIAGENKALAITGLLVEQGSTIAQIIANENKIPAILPPGIPNPAKPPSVISSALSVAQVVAETAKGIQQINSAGGPAAAGSAGGGGASSIPFGPTVSTPELPEGGIEVSTGAPTGVASDTTIQAVVEEGSIGEGVERNSRRNARRRQG